MTTPTELPEVIVPEVHALAEVLADVTGDEAAVIAAVARIGGTDPDEAAALCIATLIYTYSRCLTTTDPSTTNPKENH